MNMKTCKKCQISKSIDSYISSSSTKDKLRNWCKSCFTDYDKQRRNNLSPEYKRGRSLVRYWPELSPIQANDKYMELFKSQNEKCYICETSTNWNGKSFPVDHCHKTNEVRGILCDDCNVGLGKFKDDIEILEKAINYLRRDDE